MAFSEISYMEGMTNDQRMLFQSQYSREAKNRTTGLILTLLLGGVGGHRFYLGQVGLGILYMVFCWTFIPVIVAFFELFMIGKRVDRFNDHLAAELAARVKMLGVATP
jgi:TM2 domain-containing membrane protein YozV